MTPFCSDRVAHRRRRAFVRKPKVGKAISSPPQAGCWLGLREQSRVISRECRSTEAGKQIVSQNATTHGLTAARPFVLPEEQEEFDRFADALQQEWQPQQALEQFHLERLIHCAWRLQRITRIETSVMLDDLRPAAGARRRGRPENLGPRLHASLSGTHHPLPL